MSIESIAVRQLRFLAKLSDLLPSRSAQPGIICRDAGVSAHPGAPRKRNRLTAQISAPEWQGRACTPHARNGDPFSPFVEHRFATGFERNVARPKQALISKEQVIDVATEILERDGIEALSLRPLAARLSVNSASLYHHFENKNEILLAVVRKALREAAIPPLTENWEDWICENAIQLRRVLAHKPFLISLLLQGIRPHTVAYAISDAKLIEVGIPDTLRPEFLLTLENAVIGSALISIGEKEGKSSQIERFFDHEQLLRNTVRNLLAGMIEQFKARNGSRRATSRKASRGSAAPDNGSA